MEKLERLRLINSIKRNIKVKRCKKIIKAIALFDGISFISLVATIVFMFFPALAPLSSLVGISIISVLFSSIILFCSSIEFKILKKFDDYKKYCESYVILKNDKEKIYKVKTLDSKTIYLNEDIIYIEESESLKTSGTIKINTEDFKEKSNKKNHPKNNTTNINGDTITYNILNNSNFNYNPSIDREKELDLLQETLVMPGSVNPLIIGPAGVGKTSLVKGLVYQIKKGNVCNALKNKKIIEVSAADLVSGCKYVGEFERKMMEFINYAQKEDAIFFIDEFHGMIGLGQGERGNLDGANILKPFLQDERIKIIGATTEEEYEKIIKKDSAFTRRFEVIKLTEPRGKMLYNIISERVYELEKNNNIKFGQNEIEKKSILESLIELTDKDNKNRKYNSNINNPVLILNIIFRSFAKAKINNSNFVTIQNVCDSLENNPNLYSSSIEKILLNINNLNSNEDEFEKVKTKVIKIPNNRV